MHDFLCFVKAENNKMEAFILQVHEQESFNGSLSRSTYLPLRFSRRYSGRLSKTTHTLTKSHIEKKRGKKSLEECKILPPVL